MRRYLTRRNALLAALARYLPQATVLGAAAGVHVTVRFPAGYPVADLVRRAAAMRVNVEPLAPCYADPAAAPPGVAAGLRQPDRVADQRWGSGARPGGEVTRNHRLVPFGVWVACSG